MGVLGAEVLGEDDGEAALIVFSGDRLSLLTGDAVSDVDGTAGWMAAGNALPEATATAAAPPAKFG